jgi:hypothetical protein
MSPRSVKREAIPIPIIAIGESYPDKNGASESDNAIILIPDMVRSDNTFALIFSCSAEFHSCFESSRTVMV